MEKRYLLTGAAGHLGSTILSMLKDRGEDVRALILPGEEQYLPPDVPFVPGDIREIDSVRPLFDNDKQIPQVLIHCAGKVSVTSKKDSVLFAVNVDGTKHVMSLAREYGVTGAIYVGSSHAIAAPPRPKIVYETETYDPALVRSQYAKSKAMACAAVMDMAATGFPVVLVHPTGIIGPGDVRHQNPSVQTIRAVADGTLAVGVGGGYDFVDVRDCATAIIRCADKWFEGTLHPGTSYILGGDYISVNDMISMVRDMTGRGPVRISFPYWVAKTAAVPAEALAGIFRLQSSIFTVDSIRTLGENAQFSHQKASRELGYYPRPIICSVRDIIEESNEPERMSNTHGKVF